MAWSTYLLSARGARLQRLRSRGQPVPAAPSAHTIDQGDRLDTRRV